MTLNKQSVPANTISDHLFNVFFSRAICFIEGAGRTCREAGLIPASTSKLLLDVSISPTINDQTTKGNKNSKEACFEEILCEEIALSTVG